MTDKIIGSYLIKVHVHADVDEDDTSEAPKAPANDAVKGAVTRGIYEATGFDATVSLIEKTDD